MSASDMTFGYDAAKTYDPARSLLLFPTNSRLEYHKGTRTTLVTKQRALDGNFAVIGRIKSKFARCVAGSGIFPVPVTSDPEWNTLAGALFENWASNVHTYSIDSSRDLWEDQRLVAGELGAGDGEFFTALVRADGQPTTQPLDPFEIESPADNRRSFFEDGVRTNRFLRPAGYAVRELCGPDGAQSPWREVSAADMLHLFRRRRAKQLRGLPPMFASLNDAHDALDTLALEKATTKLHSLLAATKVRKPANKGQGLTNQLEKVLNSDGSTERLEEKFKGGAVTVELEEGEQLDLKTSSRPSQPVIEGLKFYCLLIALSADLPLSVVLSFAGLGGTAVRGDLEDAASTFAIEQDRVVWRHSQPLYVWFIADAMEKGTLRQCRDPYWWKTDWHGPAKITTDYGRSAAANIDLMKKGMLSIPTFCEERNLRWQAEQDKQIAWLKRAAEQCELHGVPFERFFEATPGAVTNLNVQQPDNSDA